VLPEVIFLPSPLNHLLKGLRSLPEPIKEQDDTEPRYAVIVSWGTRYEPWVRSISLLSGVPKSK
jgi:hypothetical protein